MFVDQALVDEAIALLEQRFHGTGGVAAAMYTADGNLLQSVYFEPEWGGGGLCAETGAICEANTRNQQITASVCVGRLSSTDPIVIMTPCGICQERLFHWGDQVEVAVPHPDDPTRWVAKTLNEIQPYYWVNAYKRLGTQ